jgi:hypothetical protein
MFVFCMFKPVLWEHSCQFIFWCICPEHCTLPVSYLLLSPKYLSECGNVSFLTMGNTVDQYWAAIGSFYSNSGGVFKRFISSVYLCILNYDLYRRNIVNSPLCSCGMREDAYQFFFTSNKYSNSRYKLMDNLLKLKDLVIIDTHLLLWGNNAPPTEVNNCIFSYVQTYINETNRFNWFLYCVVPIYIM